MMTFEPKAAARATGAVVTFIGHKHYVFRDRRYAPALVARQVIAYVAIWLFSYAASVRRTSDDISR